MIRDALGEALLRMRDTPSLWITGLYLGALFAGDLLLEVQGNSVLAARIGFLGLCALPFFIGGSYGAIQDAGTGIRGYLGAGSRYFFRILLAGAVIVSAALLTTFLVMVPEALIWGSLQGPASLTLVGVSVPFAVFTYFCDTAAVFEDRKVLDSIRRSVEFVLGNPRGALAFYLVNLGIGLLALFLSVALWSAAIADRLEPFVGANQTAFQNLTAGQLVDLIGIPGVRAGVAIGFFAVMIGGTLLVSFKACYFRRAASPSAVTPEVGEFDDKGRWYRY